MDKYTSYTSHAFFIETICYLYDVCSVRTIQIIQYHKTGTLQVTQINQDTCSKKGVLPNGTSKTFAKL